MRYQYEDVKHTENWGSIFWRFILDISSCTCKISIRLRSSTSLFLVKDVFSMRAETHGCLKQTFIRWFRNRTKNAVGSTRFRHRSLFDNWVPLEIGTHHHLPHSNGIFFWYNYIIFPHLTWHFVAKENRLPNAVRQAIVDDAKAASHSGRKICEVFEIFKDFFDVFMSQMLLNCCLAIWDSCLWMFEQCLVLVFGKYISQRGYETMTLHEGIAESEEPEAQLMGQWGRSSQLPIDQQLMNMGGYSGYSVSNLDIWRFP